MLTSAPRLLAAVVLLLLWTTISHFVLTAAEATVERIAVLEEMVYGHMLGMEPATSGGECQDLPEARP